jgi:tetratricopeptide (TPR) repeat protein
LALPSAIKAGQIITIRVTFKSYKPIQINENVPNGLPELIYMIPEKENSKPHVSPGKRDKGYSNRLINIQKKLLIAIAPICNVNEPIKDEVSARLLSELKENGDVNKNASIELLPNPITELKGSTEAKKIGELVNADFVIWGYYQKTASHVWIKIRFEFVKASNFQSNENTNIKLETEVNKIIPIGKFDSFEIQTEIGDNFSFVTLTSIASLNYMKKDWRKAIENFTAALKINSRLDNATVINYLIGYSFYKLGNLEEALASFNSSILVNKSIIDSELISKSYVMIGGVYYDYGNYSKALQYYDTAILYDDFNGYAYNNLGVLFAKKKEFKTAALYFEKAFEMIPWEGAPGRNLYNIDVGMRIDLEENINNAKATKDYPKLYKSLLASAYNHLNWEDYLEATNDLYRV